MEGPEIKADLLFFIYRIPEMFGGHGLLVVGCLAFSFFALICALIALKRGRIADDDQTLRSGLLGKLSKLEMSFNELRTDSIRTNEQFKKELWTIRGDLGEVLRIVGGTPTPADDGGFGSPPGIDPSTGGSSEPSGGGRNFKGAASSTTPTKNREASSPPPEGSLSSKLQKSRAGFFQKLKGIFSSKPVLDELMIEELESQLISSDLGVKTATSLVQELKSDMLSGDVLDEECVRSRLKSQISTILTRTHNGNPLSSFKRGEGDLPLVILIVGVNGAGKTTTVAKLAHRFSTQGSKVLVIAADTFRAAAAEQLSEWTSRVGVQVVTGQEGAKPQSVVFDGMKRGVEEKFDVILIDTAGRLHTKSNLMQELEGIRNTVEKHLGSPPQETLLVIDGSTGQNGLIQAREFNSATPLTGLVVTKLDGTPKGGIVVAIVEELGIPVRFIGVGESADDLRPFMAEEFAAALFDTSALESASSAHGAERRRRRENESIHPEASSA